VPWGGRGRLGGALDLEIHAWDRLG
jgi:hypothetical protein